MAFKFNPITGTLDLVGGGGGPAANGLPPGGIQYDLLVKNSATDYDAIWSRTLDTLTVNGLLTAPDVHGSLNGPVYIYGKNTSASTILKGTPVYVTGSVGASGQIEIGTADASNSAKMPAIGLTRADVAVNAFVDVVILGVIEQLDTSAYAINSPVYVAPGGGITPTRPTASTDLVQNIGRVDRVNHSTGIIVVLGPGRTNDVPNTIGVDLLPSTANTYDIGSATLDWQELFLRTAVYVGQAASDQTQVRANYIYYNNPAASTAFQIYTGDKTGANTSGVTIKSGDSATSGTSGDITIQTGTGATARGAVNISGSQIKTTGDILPTITNAYALGSPTFTYYGAYIRNSVNVGVTTSSTVTLTGVGTNPSINLNHTTGANYCLILTGDKTTGPTNKLLVRSGNTSTSGNSGDVEVASGTTAGGGTRGTIILNGASINASSTKITNLANGTASTDAVNFSQIPTSLPPSGSAGGSLSGTYPNPTIASGVITDTNVATANKDGLAGTYSMRTLGTGAQQACAGNDSRLSDARTPTGSAGGDLSGTYPNPTLSTTKQNYLLDYTNHTNTPATSTGTFTTGIKTAVFALTDAATITTTNIANYNSFTVTIAGNRTLGAFTTATAGQKITIRVRQDGTGGRTLAFDSTYWNSGQDVSWLSIASAANAFSYIGAIYNSVTSKWDVVSIVRGY